MPQSLLSIQIGSKQIHQTNSLCQTSFQLFPYFRFNYFIFCNIIVHALCEHILCHEPFYHHWNENQVLVSDSACRVGSGKLLPITINVKDSSTLFLIKQVLSTEVKLLKKLLREVNLLPVCCIYINRGTYSCKVKFYEIMA